MTQDAALKKAIRARQKATGEKYTAARRAVLSSPAATSAPTNPFEKALRPGRVVGVVCGGGLTNLALAMPTLSARFTDGHGLITVLSERRGVTELPSPLDVITTRGRASTEEIARLLAGGDWDAVMTLMEEAGVDQITVGDGPVATSMMEAELDRLAHKWPRHPVVWTQDIQVGQPLALGKRDDFDQIPEQVDWMKRIARNSGAAMAFGHCMPSRMRDGWEFLLDHADETIVIATDEIDASEDDGRRRATVDHYREDGSVDRTRLVIDHRFAEWRRRYLERS